MSLEGVGALRCRSLASWEALAPIREAGQYAFEQVREKVTHIWSRICNMFTRWSSSAALASDWFPDGWTRRVVKFVSVFWMSSTIQGLEERCLALEEKLERSEKTVSDQKKELDLYAGKNQELDGFGKASRKRELAAVERCKLYEARLREFERQSSVTETKTDTNEDVVATQLLEERAEGKAPTPRKLGDEVPMVLLPQISKRVIELHREMDSLPEDSVERVHREDDIRLFSGIVRAFSETVQAKEGEQYAQ